MNSGCLHGIVDLILGTNKQFFDENIQYAALCTVVNVIAGNDANRVLIIELNGIKPILTSIQTTSRDDILLEAIKALANIAYHSAFTAGWQMLTLIRFPNNCFIISGCILKLGGDSVLVEVLETTDYLKHPYIAYTALAALANIVNCEATQSHVGSAAGIRTGIVAVLLTEQKCYTIFIRRPS